jgi:hypothetical protein
MKGRAKARILLAHGFLASALPVFSRYEKNATSWRPIKSAQARRCYMNKDSGLVPLIDYVSTEGPTTDSHPGDPKTIRGGSKPKYAIVCKYPCFAVEITHCGEMINLSIINLPIDPNMSASIGAGNFPKNLVITMIPPIVAEKLRMSSSIDMPLCLFEARKWVPFGGRAGFNIASVLGRCFRIDRGSGSFFLRPIDCSPDELVREVIKGYVPLEYLTKEVDSIVLPSLFLCNEK